MHKLPTIRKITDLFSSRLFTIQGLQLEFANGQRAQFERIKANAGRAVMVAAVTDQQEIILVREYAAGTERYELQLPKGIVEADESSAQAANRELAEETGYAARKLEFIQCLRVSPGYFQHETDLILATELIPVLRTAIATLVFAAIGALVPIRLIRRVDPGLVFRS